MKTKSNRKKIQSRSLRIERLELRQVLSAATAVVTPNLIVVPDASTSKVSGFTPAQIEQAYGFNGITFGSRVGDGSNMTIAIVDAYNDPNIVSDLAAFDKQFSLAAPPSFKVVNQTGGTSLPKNDRGWSSEIALDVEWAHALAPGANILLVEAKSAYTSDLDAALDYARNAAGVVAVSNSWGGSEYSGESSEDVHFTTPAAKLNQGQGVTFTVAAGDSGAPAEYPSASPDVLSVGGSTLRLTSSGDYSSESVWSGGGGGASRYEGLPSYQSGLGVTNRGTPDVSYDANPSSGVAVYDSYGSGGWAQFGGTSAGAPQWAALVAIADQGRALAGKGSLANAQAAIYTLPRSDFHDITSGSNGSSATTGYDLASGLGSPIASSVIRDLVAFNGSTNFTVAAATGGTVRQRGWGGFGGFTGGGGSGFAGSGFGGFNFGGFFFFDEAAGGDSAAAGGPAAAIAAPGTGADSAMGSLLDRSTSLSVVVSSDSSYSAGDLQNSQSVDTSIDRIATNADSSNADQFRADATHFHGRFDLMGGNWADFSAFDNYFASLDAQGEA